MRQARLGVLFIVAAMALFWLPQDSLSAAVGPNVTTTGTAVYDCQGQGFASSLGTTENISIATTIVAPSQVTPGQVFPVSMTLSSFSISSQAPVDLNSFNIPAEILYSVTGGTATHPKQGITTFPPAGFGPQVTLPTITNDVTPTAAAGTTMVISPGKIYLTTGNTGIICDIRGGTTPTPANVAIVSSIGEPTTTPPTTTAATTTSPTTTTGGTTTIAGPTTTTAGTTTVAPTTTATTTTTGATTTTTTTAATTTTGATTTTAAPATSTPGGGAAVYVTKTASIDYDCTVSFSGSSTTQPSTMKTTIEAPDKVGIGGSFDVFISFDPGPKNGPIAFAAGAVTYTADITALSNATPASATTNSKVNSAEVKASKVVEPFEPTYYHVVPRLTARVTASGAAGTRIDLTAGHVRLSTKSPVESTTDCTPKAPAAVLSTAIVAEQVVIPTTAPTAVDDANTTPTTTAFVRRRFAATNTAVLGKSQLARTGGNLGTTTTLAAGLLGLGVLFLALGRRKLRD